MKYNAFVVGNNEIFKKKLLYYNFNGNNLIVNLQHNHIVYMTHISNNKSEIC